MKFSSRIKIKWFHNETTTHERIKHLRRKCTICMQMRGKAATVSCRDWRDSCELETILEPKIEASGIFWYQRSGIRYKRLQAIKVLATLNHQEYI